MIPTTRIPEKARGSTTWSLRVLTLITLVCALPASGASISTDYTRGIDAHRQGLYSKASELFKKELKEHPTNANASYYLADSLAKMNMHEQAIDQYRQTCRLDLKGTAGTYARTALKSYGETIADPDEVSAKVATYNSVKQMLDQVRRQAEREKSRLSPYGRSFVHAWDLHPRRRSTSSHYYPRRVQTRVRTSNWQSQQKRAVDIEDSAANLESLLLDDMGKPGPKLSPHGTNLYVRNYNHVQGEPVTPLVATADKWDWRSYAKNKLDAKRDSPE